MKCMKRFLAACAGMALLVSGMGVAPLAEEDEGIPTYELARFSSFERTYADETHNLLYGNTLYADWTRVDGAEDGHGIDVETDYPGRENLRLKITLELISSEPGQVPDTGWEQITVKLRSTDVKDKEGDPNLAINGGNSETNSEHNYGWDIRPEDVSMQEGRLELSIPLDRPADNSRGLMDWTDVQRILLTLRLRNSLVTDGLAPSYSMRLSEVRIVNDIMEITRDEIRKAASDSFPEGVIYSETSMMLFNETRQQALDLIDDEEATLRQLQDMVTQMQQVRDQMVEITYDVVRFSRMCGSYPNDSQTLYADWTYADQGGDGFGVDLSHHDFDRMMLQIELDLQGPEDYTGVWNTDGWVLLRSADEALCTYGWGLSADDPAIGRLHTGVNRLSIPLSASEEDGYTILQSDPTASDQQGRMDWGAVNRLHLYIAPEDYQKGDFSMTITMARIVDMTQPDEAMITLVQALEEAVSDGSAYTDASWQAYAAVMNTAQGIRDAYPYADARTILTAADALREAADGLEEKPEEPAYQPGNVDEKGGVEAADALLALQYATGKITLKDSQVLAADVDGTPGVTASDALLILQYATGKIAAFTVKQHN